MNECTPNLQIKGEVRMCRLKKKKVSIAIRKYFN
ncbi:unnamed protein product [Brugia timori]|uniref:Transcriptional regulator n=1 Tax=Brugia timori TaxID=42155 RepID=A0A0R3R7P2_9BILA|nr:unnamed protein product [Brugia timori]